MCHRFVTPADCDGAQQSLFVAEQLAKCCQRTAQSPDNLREGSPIEAPFEEQGFGGVYDRFASLRSGQWSWLIHRCARNHSGRLAHSNAGDRAGSRRSRCSRNAVYPLGG